MSLESANSETLAKLEEACEETNKDVNFMINCINSLFKCFADAARIGV
ncbi:MAG: hypothetical protein LBC56_06145 [Oscillospiraceae bacterium]|jgi:hypothetical protein|nr:hypothetical protein [Oscillospiraceae bacterium]